MGGIEAERVEQRALVRHFGHGHATKQVGAHIVRLGRRRVVHVAADVEIEIVGGAGDFGERHDAGVAGDVLVAVEGGHDFLDVLRAEIVLRASGMELGIGIDEEHLAATDGGLVRVGRLAGEIGPHDENARRDARAVKQVLRQADDGFDEVLFEEFLADFLFRPAAKEHAVGHDGGNHAARFAHGEHVLGEHEVAFLAGRGTPAPAETLRELHIAARVVLAERRIGDDAVEAFQFAAVLVLRVQQGVLKLNVRAGDAVQEHVQFADGPGGGVVDLAAEAEVGGVAAGLLDEFAADDEHATRTAGGVIHAQAGSGLEDAHHKTDDIAGRVEVAALFASRLGEIVDEKFVCRAEQVGELEILVAQPVATENPADEVLATVVRNDALAAFDGHEEDAIKDVLQLRVGFAESRERNIEDRAVNFGGVAEFVLEVLPTGALGNEEAVVVIRVFTVLRGGIVQRHALLDFAPDNLFVFGVEHIGAALQEEHPEDVILVGGRIEALLAQPVGGGHEMTFEFGEGKARHGLG